MMKKNKEILKQAGTMSLIYLILCLGGAYESYYRGADLRFTVKIAGCVLLFMCVGMLISMIKKEYDPRRYLGYVSLLISLGLMLQILAQGNIPGEIVCCRLWSGVGIWSACRTICNKETYCEE